MSDTSGLLARHRAVAAGVALLVAMALLAVDSPAVGAAPVPVVLVPGLNHDTGEVRPLGDVRGPAGTCSDAGSFVHLCLGLAGLGHPVYVIGAAERAPPPALDNEGPIAANAQRLATFLASTVGPAYVVGHSMGGVIARVALSREGGRATGLLTIGSPHAGSFLADLVIGAALWPCKGLACNFISGAAWTVALSRGVNALLDLTTPARLADRMAPPAVPVTAFAGTALDVGLDSYLFPNDMAVARWSAHGVGTSLEPDATPSARLWHSEILPQNQFSDPLILDLAARGAANAAGGLPARMSTAGRTASESGATDRAPVELTLNTARAVRPPGTANARLMTAAAIVSTRPFTLVCDGQELPAVELASRLHGMAPAGLRCRSASVRATRAVLVADNPAQVRAVFEPARRGWSLRLRATRRVRRAWLLKPGERVPLRVRAGRVRLPVRTGQLRGAHALQVEVGPRRYAAGLPPSLTTE